MPLEEDNPSEIYTAEFRHQMQILHEVLETERNAYLAGASFANYQTRLRLVQRRMNNAIKVSEKRAQRFADRDLVRIYRQGLIQATGNPNVRLNRTDTAAIARIVSETERVFNKAFIQMRADTTRIRYAWAPTRGENLNKPGAWRSFNARVRRDYITPLIDDHAYIATNPLTLAKKIGGSASAGRIPETIGIKQIKKDWSALRPAEKVEARDAVIDWQLAGNEELVVRGRRWKVGNYFDMVARTNGGRAYTNGLINGYVRQGVTVFEISDGTQCGWRYHADPIRALDVGFCGPEDARRYALSHPNCVRTFKPRPDLKEKPPRADVQGRSARTAKISDALQDWKSNLGLTARSGALILKDTAKTTALGLGSDLLRNQQMRQMVFNSVIQSHAVMRMYDGRVKQFIDYVGRRTGIWHTEREVADNVVQHIDDWIATGRYPKPAYVRQILTGSRDANLRRVVGGPTQGMDWFDTYREMVYRRDLSHFNLNVINSIEERYGTEWLKETANRLGGLSDIDHAIRQHMDRYAAYSSKHPSRAGEMFSQFYLGQVKRIPEQIYKRTLKTPFDTAAEHIPFMKAGKMTMVRLSNRRLDLEHLGIRYRWSSRFVKFQTTSVNRYRFMPLKDLQRIAVAKGVDVRQAVRLSKPNEIVQLIAKYKSRDSLLEELGFNLGFLTRITITPHDLIRVGFYWDPKLGWRRPLPNVTLRTPPLPGGLRVRTVARVNRAFKPTAGDIGLMPYHWRNSVRRGATGIYRRYAAQNAVPLYPDGTLVRSISQELAITFGGRPLTIGGKTIVPFGTRRFIGGKPISGPGGSLGFRTNTFVGRMNDMKDVKEYMRIHGVKGYMEDLTFISMMGELRAMGWSWFRLGKTFNIHPADIPALVRNLHTVWPDMMDQARRSTLISRLGLYEKAKDREIEYLARKIAEYEDLIRGQRGKGFTSAEDVRRLRAYKALLRSRTKDIT